MLTVESDTAPANIYGYTAVVATNPGLTIQTVHVVATMKRDIEGYLKDVPNVVAFQNTV